MKIFDNVKHNSISVTLFTEFLIGKGYDVKHILLSDNHLETICYYIEFLETEDIFIITDHNGYVVYKQLQNNQILIEGKLLNKNIVPKLIAGINNAFNYIENPF
jgi:hypothetical protein